MSELTLSRGETQAIKYPPAIFQTVSGIEILGSSPSEVATRRTKMRHLGHMLGSSSVLQSDQSLSRALFEFGKGIPAVKQTGSYQRAGLIHPTT
jgi:hypothetical protein